MSLDTKDFTPPVEMTAGEFKDDHWFLARANEAVLSTAPLAPAALGLVTGIFADERAGWNAGVFLALFVGAMALAIIGRVRRQIGIALMFAAGLSLGGVLHWSRERVASSRDIKVIVGQEETIARVRGRIASEPALRSPEAGVFAAWETRGESTAFLLSVKSLESQDGWKPAAGLLRVSVNEPLLDLSEGDNVQVFGKLMPLRPPANPGSFDWRAYYRQQGVHVRMFCDQRENVVRLGRERRSLATWLRAKSRGLLTDDLVAGAGDEASLLEAMVLGHRSRFDRRLNEMFTRAGCVHFIAASGTNIVILMGALWLAGRLAGLDKRQCAWLMIPAIILYGLVAEPRPPILRACVMGLLFCASLLLQRNPGNLNWISAAAIILCFLNPMTIFDIGFQLSFAAVLGVAYVAPALWYGAKEYYWWFREVILRDAYARADLRLYSAAARFAPVSTGHRIRTRLSRAAQAIGVIFAVSLGAWLCTLPITSIWFQQIQTWGVISSVLVYPLISIIMVLGVVKVGVAAISPVIAWPITAVLGQIDTFLVWLVEKLATLPVASPTVPAPPFWLTASFYLPLVAIAMAFKKRPPQSQESGLLQVSTNRTLAPRRVVVAAALLAIGLLGWLWNLQGKPHLAVTVLAVGAGSATVIELPEGQTILYDGGSMANVDVGQNIIAPFLRHRGIHHIDRMYVSHPNLDHFSGIPELAQQIPIHTIVWNHCFQSLATPRSPAAGFVKYLTKNNQAIEILDPHERYWNLGGVEFEVFWPPEGSCSGLTANDSSTVMQLSYGGQAVLFTGDIEEKALRSLRTRGDLKSDIILLPHHGSVCVGTGDFLKSVGAGVFIRSSNEATSETTNGLPNLVGDAELYNTADVGAVTVLIDGNGFRVESWLDPAGSRSP